MEIFYLENILNLGNIGDKVKVKNGYGRNFFFKTGKLGLTKKMLNLDKKRRSYKKKLNQKINLKKLQN